MTSTQKEKKKKQRKTMPMSEEKTGRMGNK